MSATVTFPGKRLVLAAAIAAALPLGGCSTMREGVSAATPIYPIQRHVGLMERSSTTDMYEHGRVYFQGGKYGLALEAFRADLAKHPHSVAALNGVGAVYDKLGRYDLAVSYYYRALQIDPDSARTLSNLGYSFLLQGRPAAARGVLEMAAALDPQNPVVARNLGMAVERMADAKDDGNAVALEAATAMPPAAKPVIDMVAVTRQEAIVPEVVAAGAATEAEPESPPAQVVSEVGHTPVAVHVPASPAQEPLTVDEPSALHGAAPSLAPVSAMTSSEQEAVSLSDIEKPNPQRVVSQQEETVRYTLRSPDGQQQADLKAKAAPRPVDVASQRMEVTAPSVAVTDSPAIVADPVSSEAVVVLIDRTPPSAKRSISEQSGHVQLAFNTPEGSVEVSNGNGYEGMAALLSRYYDGLGQQVAHVTNADSFDHARTVIYYRADKRDVAERLRDRLPVAATLRETKGMRTDARVVLGRDIGFYQGAIRRIAESRLPASVVSDGRLDLASTDARIEVSNGNGRNGMARLLSRVLGGMGETITRVTNADNFNYATTRILYAPGQERDARALAARLPVDAQLVMISPGFVRRNVSVRVIIGQDFLDYEHVMHGMLAATASEETGV